MTQIKELETSEVAQGLRQGCKLVMSQVQHAEIGEVTDLGGDGPQGVPREVELFQFPVLPDRLRYGAQLPVVEIKRSKDWAVVCVDYFALVF
jgi:hypothetical protein